MAEVRPKAFSNCGGRSAIAPLHLLRNPSQLHKALQVEDGETVFSVSGKAVTRCVDALLVYIISSSNKVGIELLSVRHIGSMSVSLLPKKYVHLYCGLYHQCRPSHK